MRTWKALVLATFALGLALRLPTFSRVMLSDDEAIYATTADAMARGGLLYRDVVDHKPPLIYYVYRAGFALAGPYGVHGAHVLVVLAVLATGALLLAVGRQAGPGNDSGPGASDRVALAAAGLFLVFSTTWHDYDALAANCELFLLVPQTAAAWLLMRTLTDARPRRGARDLAAHLAVGLLIGLSALFKVQGLTFLGASLGLLGWWTLLGRMSRGGASVGALAHLAGAAAPSGLYLAWCALAGNLEAALYWFRFNFSYVGAGLTGVEALVRGVRRTALIGGAALVPYALGIGAAVATAAAIGRVLLRRRRHDGGPVETPSPVAVLGLLWLGTSAVAVAAGGRFFGHYFHLVLAPLCLLAAPSALRLASTPRRRLLLGALVALPTLSFFALATLARPLTVVLDEHTPSYAEVAARIAALTTPDQRIFVWGNSPQLYVLARRPMGARFSFCNYMTGESPGTPTETGQRNADANQLAPSWDMLFSDLDTRRPTLFVDAAAAGWDGYEKYPLVRYPALRAYVDRHYVVAETVDGVVIYRRRRAD